MPDSYLRRNIDHTIARGRYDYIAATERSRLLSHFHHELKEASKTSPRIVLQIQAKAAQQDCGYVAEKIAMKQRLRFSSTGTAELHQIEKAKTLWDESEVKNCAQPAKKPREVPQSNRKNREIAQKE